MIETEKINDNVIVKLTLSPELFKNFFIFQPYAGSEIKSMILEQIAMRIDDYVPTLCKTDNEIKDVKRQLNAIEVITKL